MLVVTLGDPLGVTVEVLQPLLARERPERRHPVVLTGSAWQWADQALRLGLSGFSALKVHTLAEIGGKPGLYFLDVGTSRHAAPAEALDDATRGDLAVRSLAALQGLSLPAGERLAVLTAPIDKHACAAAGFPFPGQTEYFENLWGGRAIMTLAGARLRVGLVTNHLALAAVAAAVTGELVEEKLRLFVRTLRESFAVARPRIAICGLNPHASDQGLFGDEEAKRITPAAARVQRDFPDCEIAGPLPADTVFYRAVSGRYDGVLAMYHDQGLGPLKTVHFDDAVNLSGGLAHLRVSPDHGPARDLFLAGQASGRSFAEALALATRYLDGGCKGP